MKRKKLALPSFIKSKISIFLKLKKSLKTAKIGKFSHDLILQTDILILNQNVKKKPVYFFKDIKNFNWSTLYS